MDLTVSAISGLSFAAVFFYDHLLSKRHPNRTGAFFRDFENWAMLLFLLLFVGAVSGLLSLSELRGWWSEMSFRDLESLNLVKGLVFGISAHKLLGGNPTTFDEIAADDIETVEVPVPVWRRFHLWRNA
ncbi:hypothetical protein [Oceaniradius stylonematis]|jgi:hypothetical protein|uniref:hypothetical protein n=1 Tax=Oceaniradius stylonematis TaxID=2184161 RepID=UPI0035D0D039